MDEMKENRDLRLQDRVAIVTGGTGGIGRATCQALAAEGAKIVIVDRFEDRIEELQKDLKETEGSNPETLGLALDVAREADMEAMARQTQDRFGRIDFLITCAGILRAPGSLPKPMVEVSEEEWDVVIDINLKGVFLSNRAVLPAMIAQKSGTILNLSSTSGRQGRAHDAPYCASKFGVIGLSESLAEEVRLYGIKVQAILPDAIDTPLWEQNGPIKPEYALPPERVADLIVYMLTLPADTLLVAPAIAPFRTRGNRRRGKGK
ncbi:MAG: SDR family oxidoreductase [Cyanobacteriota bacterium]|nr:SDR family oxidoreductase [Cyanobacteriota bacterium]